MTVEMSRYLRRLELGSITVVLSLALELGSGCKTPAGNSGGGSIRVLAPNALPPHNTGLTAEEVNQGMKLHIAKCLRCHAFYDPAPYTDAEWLSWMRKMSKKSHLQPPEDELLSRYLAGFRTPQASGGSQ
jgi:hypothetical protein